MQNNSHNPFIHNYFVGYVNEVFPQYINVHFPSSVLLKSFIHECEELSGGLVGNYLTIEGEDYGFIGKILEVSLPDSERKELSEKAFQYKEAGFHPIAKVEILISFNIFNPSIGYRGVSRFPAIGSKVYVCSRLFFRKYIEKFGIKDNETNPKLILIGKTTSNNAETIISLNSLYNRHCAVVGTTGGGKSWTIATLMSNVIENNIKAILIDATGEYSNFENHVKVENINLGGDDAYFHYSNLTVDDMFFLLKPSGRVQAPKLMEAIRSLKMVKINGGLSIEEVYNKNKVRIDIIDGILRKAGADKKAYEVFYYKHIKEIEDGRCGFSIKYLASQISNECIWDTVQGDNSKYGGRNENDISNCITLISRINNLINIPEYSYIFGFENEDKEKDIITIINKFIETKEKNILRINFRDVKFDFQAREILANAIGRYLLDLARKNAFKTNPLILFIDEAHQFLNKAIKDEYFDTKPLESFDLIAKECRKYGLFLCLSTQMPRDIPTGTLSQIGTFIVHRLINDLDKKSIENACSSANKSILSFMPVLGEGEAVLLGVDFPMPLTIKINKPSIVPESGTPKL
jgi:DNA helicase HerA-like ATPase